MSKSLWKGEVYLSQDDYDTLLTSGSVTLPSGETITYSEDYTYIVPEVYDSTPTSGSTNPVTSGGVYTALASKQATLTAGTNITISGTTISAKDTTYSSKSATSGGTDVSLVTTGEKYTWNNKSDLTIGNTATTAAAGNHTHNYAGSSSAGGAATDAMRLKGNGRISSANITHYYTNDANHMQVDIATSTMTTGKPMADGYIQTYLWDNSGSYDTQLYIPNSNSSNQRPQIRFYNNSAWTDWQNLPYSSDIPHLYEHNIYMINKTVNTALTLTMTNDSETAFTGLTDLLSALYTNGFTEVTKAKMCNGSLKLGDASVDIIGIFSPSGTECYVALIGAEKENMIPINAIINFTDTVVQIF